MASFTRNINGLQAVQDVMRVLAITPPSAVASSQDATARQLWALATQFGQQLCTKHEWQVLSREFHITTVIGQVTYSLPDDFDGFILDSAWNRTTRLPAIGSLRQYEWQALKARSIAGTAFTMLFRLEQNVVTFYETPGTVQQIYLPYRSRSWVVKEGTIDYRDNLEDDSDVILFDSQLFKLGLHLEWLKAKGFDTTAKQRDFDEMLTTAKGRDTPARTLSLVPTAGFPYLGVLNLPDTGYGSSS